MLFHVTDILNNQFHFNVFIFYVHVTYFINKKLNKRNKNQFSFIYSFIKSF